MALLLFVHTHVIRTHNRLARHHHRHRPAPFLFHCPTMAVALSADYSPFWIHFSSSPLSPAATFRPDNPIPHFDPNLPPLFSGQQSVKKLKVGKEAPSTHYLLLKCKGISLLHFPLKGLQGNPKPTAGSLRKSLSLQIRSKHPHKDSSPIRINRSLCFRSITKELSEPFKKLSNPQQRRQRSQLSPPSLIQQHM